MATHADHPPGRRFVVIGQTAEAERVIAALRRMGDDVAALEAPNDQELADALTTHGDGLAVLLHDDTGALRYCLAAEHIKPGTAIHVALFDRTAAGQLESVVPTCRVLSPADVAVPSLLAAAVSDEILEIRRRSEGGWEAATRRGSGAKYVLPRSLRWQGLLGRLMGQLKPHDAGSRLLLGGLFGLVLLLALDTTGGVLVHKESLVLAFHAAVRTIATAGPVPVTEDHPTYLFLAALAMLATIGLTAMFTAGIVEHLLTGRLVGLFGRRVLPQRGHVVVVGMGQVGLRLAAELRAMGVAVVGVDRDSRAPNIVTARALGIPIHVGDAARRRVLQRVRLDRAIALCAVASDELDNVAVAVTARAVNPQVRVVMRAGNHDAIEETQSLFRIGRVCDVTGLTADYVVAGLRERADHLDRAERP